MSTSRFEPLSLPGLAWPVELRPHPRARAMRLRLDEARQRLILSFPKRASSKAALDWAARQGGWVDGQLGRIEPAEPFRPGGTIPLEGMTVCLHWDSALPRTPRLIDRRLQCGGPIESFAARIERFLRAQARDRLNQATRVIAERAGVTVRSVAVADAGTRWGSCSASGAIRYSWRIVLAPPHLLNWLVAHEVAHRRYMNHGPQFRALEAQLYGGDVAAARAELRALGPRLKRVGRLV
ncbi:MAG TPA: YgjP-like metallopeptidase domain-containing protein [Sphingomicrobium sp.]|nr:YgjP-like metallopeptidase domain-containing protein [Sphingomicrobium sp.]